MNPLQHQYELIEEYHGQGFQRPCPWFVLPDGMPVYRSDDVQKIADMLRGGFTKFPVRIGFSENPSVEVYALDLLSSQLRKGHRVVWWREHPTNGFIHGILLDDSADINGVRSVQPDHKDRHLPCDWWVKEPELYREQPKKCEGA